MGATEGIQVCKGEWSVGEGVSTILLSADRIVYLRWGSMILMIGSKLSLLRMCTCKSMMWSSSFLSLGCEVGQCGTFLGWVEKSEVAIWSKDSPKCRHAKGSECVAGLGRNCGTYQQKKVYHRSRHHANSPRFPFYVKTLSWLKGFKLTWQPQRTMTRPMTKRTNLSIALSHDRICTFETEIERSAARRFDSVRSCGSFLDCQVQIQCSYAATSVGFACNWWAVSRVRGMFRSQRQSSNQHSLQVREITKEWHWATIWHESLLKTRQYSKMMAWEDELASKDKLALFSSFWGH